MATHPIAIQTAMPPEASALVRRLVLPRIALTLIGIASVAGVWLTMTGHGAIAWEALVRWVHLAALGVLAGGAMWRGLFVRPPEESDHRAAVARFVLAERRRFSGIGIVATAVAALTLPHLGWLWHWTHGIDRVLIGANVVALLAGLTATAVALFEKGAAFEARCARGAFVFLTLALVITAIVDARLTFPLSASALVLRPIHVAAFGLWLGGAVWNIFVAIPAARETLSVPTVIAAAHQLERFRKVVHAILPLLIATGLVQALPYTGLDPAVLLGSTVGHVILLKLGLVVTLVAIFITCPLWRGCSPIRGMCDLEELDSHELPEPTRRLDNRGRACAGFVHVRRALADLRPGDTLELLSSDRISWEELPAWLARHGYVLVHRERWGALWWRSCRYLIRKPDDAPGALSIERTNVRDHEEATR